MGSTGIVVFAAIWIHDIFVHVDLTIRLMKLYSDVNW